MAEPTVRSPEIVTRKPLPAAVIRAEGIPVERMIPFLDEAFSALRAAVDAAALAPVAPAYSRYETELEGEVTVEAGIPLLAALDGPVEFNGVEIVAGQAPGGEIARAVHIGPYTGLRETWQEFLTAVRALGREPRKPYLESYLVAPGPGTDPDAFTTELVALLEPLEASRSGSDARGD